MTITHFLSWPVAIIGSLALTAAVARSQSTTPKSAPPRLRVVPIELDLSDPKRPVDPIVFFAAPDLYGPERLPRVTGLLRREVYRQAVLLAARDELGLTARDELLGDAPPPDLPANNRIRVNPRFDNSPNEVKIEVGPPAASRVIWRAESHDLALMRDEHILALTLAEGLSRGEYVSALKRAGLRGTPNRIDAKAAVPAEAEKRLGRVTFTDQYAATRLLHEAIRTHGESPATVGALSRAYANLGLLTDTQWGGLPWVFKARGLLYAERLRQRAPSSPLGYWHRAYAAALAGLHRDALADLAAADKARGPTPTPEWAALTDALCRFDSARLKAAGDGPFGDLAILFHFLTIENTFHPVRTLAAGADVLKRLPDCNRVHDSLAQTGGVGAMHSTSLAGLTAFTETFRDHVGELPGLPKAVTDALPETTPEPDLVKALYSAGRSRDDRGEPSWAAVARFAQEARLVQVNSRLLFLRRALAVPANEFFDEVKPLVADHPLYPYLETYTIDPRNRAEHVKRLRGLQVPEITLRHYGLTAALRLLGEDEATRFGFIASQHGAFLYHDSYLYYRTIPPDGDASQFGRRILEVSPHAPIARAAIIAHEKKLSKEELTAWEKDAQHPEVFVALARRALAENRPADAEKSLARAIDLSPDRSSYRLLADVYKRKGDTAKWLTTLESFLKEPDPGLAHAQIQVEIANHFMDQKDFKRAQPYAESAAATGAHWALLCASRCADGLEEWDKAEGYVRRATERYEQTSYHNWFFWCLRTGRGDRAAAQEFVAAHLKRMGNRRGAGDILVDAVYRAAIGQPKRVPELFKAAADLNPTDFNFLAAAVESDFQGDAAGRDRLLARWPRKGPYDPFVALLRGRLAKGETAVPETAEIDQTLLAAPPGDRANTCYLVGRFLQRRGKAELAAEYFRRCIAEAPSNDHVTPALSGLALQELQEKK